MFVVMQEHWEGTARTREQRRTCYATNTETNAHVCKMHNSSTVLGQNRRGYKAAPGEPEEVALETYVSPEASGVGWSGPQPAGRSCEARRRDGS